MAPNNASNSRRNQNKKASGVHLSCKPSSIAVNGRATCAQLHPAENTFFADSQEATLQHKTRHTTIVMLIVEKSSFRYMN